MSPRIIKRRIKEEEEEDLKEKNVMIEKKKFKSLMGIYF